jgi:hypothetical protein
MMKISLSVFGDINTAALLGRGQRTQRKDKEKANWI